MTSKYFAYEVSTVVTLIDHELTTPPSLAVCYEHHLPRNVTPKIIAKLTPSANESFEQIDFISKSSNLKTVYKNRLTSNSNLIVERHLGYKTVCYSYGFRSNHRVDNRLKTKELTLYTSDLLLKMSRNQFFYIIYDSAENESPFV